MMQKREIAMNDILECLQELVAGTHPIRPDSDMVNELGLESIKVMNLLMMLEDKLDISIPINILLNVRTPEQLLEAITLHLEGCNGPV